MHLVAVVAHSHLLGPALAFRLKKAMDESNLSYRALEKASGVSRSTIANLLNGLGGQAGIGTVYDLAIALGVSPCWLAYGLEPPTEK